MFRLFIGVLPVHRAGAGGGGRQDAIDQARIRREQRAAKGKGAAQEPHEEAGQPAQAADSAEVQVHDGALTERDRQQLNNMKATVSEAGRLLSNDQVDQLREMVERTVGKLKQKERIKIVELVHGELNLIRAGKHDSFSQEDSQRSKELLDRLRKGPLDQGAQQQLEALLDKFGASQALQAAVAALAGRGAQG